MFASTLLVVNGSTLSIRNLLFGILFGCIFVLIGLIGFNHLIGSIDPGVQVNFTVIGANNNFLNWNEYKNEKFNFSLRYPNGVKVFDTDGEKDDQDFLLFTNANEEAKVLAEIPLKSAVLTIFTTKKDQTPYKEKKLEDIVMDLRKKHEQSFEVSKIERRLLNGMTAYTFLIYRPIYYSGLVTDYNFPSTLLKVSLIEKDPFIYELVYKPFPVNDKILSTFKSNEN